MAKSHIIRLSLIVLLVLLGSVQSQAQEPITVTVALPNFYADTMKGSIDDFMEANPDVVVEIISSQQAAYAPKDGVETYLDDMAEYVRSADVLVGTAQFNVLSTRAGYFLDLAPLVNADASFDVSAFFPSMWESYQWDGAIWALPLAGDVIGMAYDAEAFDEAGLTYPNENWTLDDLVLAADELAVYGEGDTVEQPPVRSLTNPAFVSMAVLPQPLYDPMQLEGMPDFSNPLLSRALETYEDLVKDGYISLDQQSLDLPPIMFSPSVITAATRFMGSDKEYSFTTLPGGAVAVVPIAAGISSGSQYPEASYRLIKFLTEDAGAFTSLVGQPLPARRELFGAESSNPLFNLTLPEDLQQQVLDYAETAVPYRHMLFSEYIDAAATNAVQSDVSAEDAINEIEIQALDDLAAAAERRSTEISVNQPRTSIIGTGDIDLTFGFVTYAPQIPNVESLENLIDEFVMSDPQVRTIELQRITFLAGEFSLSDYADDVDCYYQPYRIDQNEDISLLLPLDPLLSVDPNLSVNDFVGPSLSLLQINGQTYGIPLVIQPEVLYYNVDLFNARGAFLPYQGWSVTDFEQTLRTMYLNAGDPPVLEPRSYDLNYVLTLIAAYGGLPLDYRTSPVGIDFTGDANFAAIQQVLDLIKDGYIGYRSQLDAAALLSYEQQANPAMYVQVLSNVYEGLIPESDENQTETTQISSTYRLVTFPQGTQYTALSFDIGSVYITAQTQYAEPCFRFISALTERPDLFSGMPARRSVINSDIVRQTDGEEAVAFYNTLDTITQQPGNVVFPTQTGVNSSQIGDALAQLWLSRAFDHYVFDDADLMSELIDAEQSTQEYMVCIGQIAPFDAREEDSDIMDYVGEIAQCAVNVDPSFRDLFAAYLQ